MVAKAQDAGAFSVREMDAFRCFRLDDASLAMNRSQLANRGIGYRELWAKGLIPMSRRCRVWAILLGVLAMWFSEGVYALSPKDVCIPRLLGKSCSARTSIRTIAMNSGEHPLQSIEMRVRP